jgi:hypothetical protein
VEPADGGGGVAMGAALPPGPAMTVGVCHARAPKLITQVGRVERQPADRRWPCVGGRVKVEHALVRWRHELRYC